MQLLTRASLLLSGLFLTGSLQPAFAQSKSSATGYIPWFTVLNKAIVVQTGSLTKPLGKDVTLPNGIRVEYRTQSLVLADGRRVVMKEGDLLNLNGEFIQKPPSQIEGPAPAATSPAAAPTPTPTAPELTAAAATNSAPALAALPYWSATPVGGNAKAVVDLSASGLNLFIVRVDGKHSWKLEKSELGNRSVLQKTATAEDLRTGLKAYVDQITRSGVDAADIYFVMSSRAASSEETRRVAQELEDLRYAVATVMPENEGEFGLRSALPPLFADKAFVVDIGPINTKISWLEAGQPHVVYTYGTRYLEKNTDANLVAADIKEKAGQVPAKLRGTCFIIGDLPAELAKAGRQGQEPYTVLQPASAYPAPATAPTQAGLSIYQAVAATTGCAKFVFGYDTNPAVGYLLSLP